MSSTSKPTFKIMTAKDMAATYSVNDRWDEDKAPWYLPVLNMPEAEKRMALCQQRAKDYDSGWIINNHGFRKDPPQHTWICLVMLEGPQYVPGHEDWGEVCW